MFGKRKDYRNFNGGSGFDVMKEKFPRFFTFAGWSYAIFIKIDNEKDFGRYFFKNSKSRLSGVVKLKTCLENKTYKEISIQEAALML